ncbi:MAG TPA: DUF503 domain-containing protein, partial [Candidatus Omnitrophica bacterium]|nr:DUF503 domain-containing protein [Candidatus Omnitrophota bacterium]
MIVGVLHVDLHLPFAQSLKDKRSVLKSLKDQLHNRFHIAVAEDDANVKWQRAALGIAALGGDRVTVERCFQQIVEWLDTNRFIELIRVEQEWRGEGGGGGG